MWPLRIASVVTILTYLCIATAQQQQPPVNSVFLNSLLSGSPKIEEFKIFTFRQVRTVAEVFFLNSCQFGRLPCPKNIPDKGNGSIIVPIDNSSTTMVPDTTVTSPISTLPPPKETTRGPETTTSTNIPTTKKSTDDSCGGLNYNVHFKYNGQSKENIRVIQFPWVVKVAFNNLGNRVHRIGTLINPKAVLTIADHLDGNAKLGSVQELNAFVQPFDSNDDEGKNGGKINVSDIIFHRDWKPHSKIGNASMNYAILTLAEPLHLSTKASLLAHLPKESIEFEASCCFAVVYADDSLNSTKVVNRAMGPSHYCDDESDHGKFEGFSAPKTRICDISNSKDFPCSMANYGSPVMCPKPENSSEYVVAGIMQYPRCSDNTRPQHYLALAPVRQWISDTLKTKGL